MDHISDLVIVTTHLLVAQATEGVARSHTAVPV